MWNVDDRDIVHFQDDVIDLHSAVDGRRTARDDLCQLALLRTGYAVGRVTRGGVGAVRNNPSPFEVGWGQGFTP